MRFRGDEEKAAAVYEGVEPITADEIAECVLFALTRPPHVNIDEIVVKALAQSRGGRILRDGVATDADDPRRLDLLHLRRARRHRRRDERLLRGGHALPLALSADDQRRAAAAALLRQGRVLLGRVLPAQPARGRAARRTRSRSRASASSARACRSGIVVQNELAEPRRVRARARGRAATSRTSSRSRTTTSRSATRARAQPLPPPRRADGRRATTGQLVCSTEDGAARATQVDPLAARRGRRRHGPRGAIELGPRERLERARRRRRLARRRRVRARRSSSSASARSSRTSATRSPRGSCACRSCARAGTTLDHAFDAVGRRPRGAADARRSDGVGEAAGGGDAVVHDRLRPRHDHHLPADAALRPGARAQRARGARRAAGDGGRPDDRRRAGQDRPRAAPRQGGGDAGSRATTAPSTRRRSTSILLSEVWRWTDDAALVARAPRARAARARVDRPATATATATASSSTSGARRRGLENQSWKDSGDSQRFADGTLAAHADRAVRGAGLRLRREAAAWPSSRARSGATAELAERLEREAEELRERFDEAFWVDERGGYYALALDGDKRPVDSLCSNIGHLLWSGIVPPERVEAIVDALHGRRALVRLGRAHDVERRRRLQPARVPQRHRLAARQLPDRGGARARGPLAPRRQRSCSACSSAARHFDYQLPEVFAGFRARRDAVPDRLPDRGAAAGVGGRHAGAAAAACCSASSPTGARQALDDASHGELPSWAGSLRLAGVQRVRPTLGRARRRRTGV